MHSLLLLLACLLYFVSAQNLTEANNATDVQQNVTEIPVVEAPASDGITVVPMDSRAACFSKFRNCASRVARQQFGYNNAQDGKVWRYLAAKTTGCEEALRAAKRLDSGRDFEVSTELGLQILQCIQTTVDNLV